MSIRAIAEAVGVTPPAIYLHFEDKTALLVAVSGRHWQRFEQEIRDATAGIDDPIVRLRAAGRAYVRWGLENPEPYRILFMTRPGSAPEQFGGERVHEDSCFAYLVSMVSDAIAGGRLRTDDAFLAATGLWTAAHGVTSLLLSRPAFPWPERDRIVDHVLDAHLGGLAQ